MLFSGEILIHWIFNKICFLEEEGEPEEKSEEEIEIIDGQEEGNKSNKSGSEDEVSFTKVTSGYDHCPWEITTAAAVTSGPVGLVKCFALYLPAFLRTSSIVFQLCS